MRMHSIEFYQEEIDKVLEPFFEQYSSRCTEPPIASGIEPEFIITGFKWGLKLGLSFRLIDIAMLHDRGELGLHLEMIKQKTTAEYDRSTTYSVIPDSMIEPKEYKKANKKLRNKRL